MLERLALWHNDVWNKGGLGSKESSKGGGEKEDSFSKAYVQGGVWDEKGLKMFPY